MALPDFVEVEDVIPRSYQDQIEAEFTSETAAWYFRLEPGRTTRVLGESGVDALYSGFTNTVFHIENPPGPPRR